MKNLTPRAKNALILLALSIVAVIGFWFGIVPALFAHKSEPVSVPSPTATPSPTVSVSGSAGVNLNDTSKKEFVPGGYLLNTDGSKTWVACSAFLEDWKHYQRVCLDNVTLPDKEKKDYSYELETGKLFASPYGDLDQPAGAWHAVPELISEDGQVTLFKGNWHISPEEEEQANRKTAGQLSAGELVPMVPQSSTVTPAIPSAGEEPVTVVGSSSPSHAPVQKSMSVASAPAPSASAPAPVATAPVKKPETAPVAMAVASAPAPAPSASAPASSVVIPEQTYPTKTQVICPLSVNAMKDPTNGNCVIIYTDKIQFPSEGFRNTVWICPSNINPLQQPTNGNCAVSYYNGVKK